MNFKKIFTGFNSKKVLIVGDAMVDAYMWGEINRMSPEAPVPVVEVKKHENRLGGAANVALNIQALGATPILCSVIGDDNQSILLKELMLNSKISTKGIFSTETRKTTTKTRVISNEKHQLRIDEENTEPIQVEDEFINMIKKFIDEIDVVILQDYNKGVLTPKVITSVIKLANNRDIPTIVDPKKKNFDSYKNCSIFKPNLVEIKTGMNIDFDADNTNEIKRVSRDLLLQLSSKAVLLTLSERGIAITSKKKFKYTPAFDRKIIDVSGAGDTVISVASLCLASKIDYITLSKISSLAGGIVCEDIGVVPINKEKLLTESQKILV